MSEEDETTTTNTVKTASDGTVKIAVEKYNELLETIANQKGSISRLNTQLNQARAEPPVINRTVVEKTAEMLAQGVPGVGGHLHGRRREPVRRWRLSFQGRSHRILNS